MKAYQIGTVLLAVLTAVMMFQNCGIQGDMMAASAQPPVQDKLAPYKNMESRTLSQVIESLITKDLRCNQSSDCVAVALGERACGGPEKYVVASQLNSDIDLIDELASLLAQKDHEFNAQSGMASICVAEMRPAVSCVARTCQTSLDSALAQ